MKASRAVRWNEFSSISLALLNVQRTLTELLSRIFQSEFCHSCDWAVIIWTCPWLELLGKPAHYLSETFAKICNLHSKHSFCLYVRKEDCVRCPSFRRGQEKRVGPRHRGRFRQRQMSGSREERVISTNEDQEKEGQTASSAALQHPSDY